MSGKFYFFQNRIRQAKNVFLNPNDLGLLRGYGVFDFLRTFNGKPFLLREHLRRFQNSARILKIPLPKKQKELAEIINKLLEKNKFKEATIRVVLTGGVGKDSLTPNNKPTLIILIERLHPFPKEYYAKGIKIVTIEYQRENPRAKTLNYICPLQNRPNLERARAQEVLYIYRGNILECSTSNLFLFKDDVLVTPKEDVLLGTTRNLVLKLASQKFKVKERRVKIRELQEVNEVFITATLKEIMPVSHIDKLKIGNGRPGKNTQIIQDLFREYIQRRCYR